ncbi:hypothetical protein ESCO_004881 [Escovopsis weberi]|uniref:Uncharacterized protein n=1 Tax=Escovopsis weberi TaxID=150374 RepID=A0A0M8MR53_ESCWE|nr:hypothetical protein ESCO_004881 [Escovopsis weberi]
MRFATILASGLFAVAVSAQSSASPSESLSPAQAAELECLNSCKPDDVNCKAHCEKIPSPNASQAVSTNNCVAKCSQGDGSAAATKAYEQCVSACITNNYYTTDFGTPEQTPAPKPADSGKGSDSGSDSDSDSGSGSGSGSNSGSGSGKGDGSSGSGATKTAGSAAGSRTTGATATPTDNAAPYVAGSAMLGLMGMVLAL